MIDYISYSTYENEGRTHVQDLKNRSTNQSTNSCLPTASYSLASANLANKPSATTPKRQLTLSSAVSKEVSYSKRIWQNKGASAFRIFNIQMQQINQLYRFRRAEEVLQFFRRYGSLIPLLIEAANKIKLYFPDTHMFLQFVADPDNTEQDDGDLVVSMVTSMTPLDAVENLEQFYQKWWFYIASEFQSSDKICFNLECI